MINLDNTTDKSARISKGALVYNDPLCVETLRLFSEIYGVEAGNLTLKTMSLGGVYIVGGIAPKIVHFLQNGTFLNAFVSKMLRAMPLKVSLNPETALLSAIHYAKDKDV